MKKGDHEGHRPAVIGTRRGCRLLGNFIFVSHDGRSHWLMASMESQSEVLGQRQEHPESKCSVGHGVTIADVTVTEVASLR